MIKQKTKKIIGTILVIISVIGIVVVLFRPGSSAKLRVLDQRLVVIDWEFKRGKAHSAYFGGLEGRLRQKLHEYKIPVTRFGGVRANFENETRALTICYGGRFSPTEAESVESILVDSQGRETRLDAPGEFNMPSRGEYGRVWVLKQGFEKGSALLLRVGTNLPLAKITIEE